MTTMMIRESSLGSFRKKFSGLDTDDPVVRINTHGGTPVKVVEDQSIITSSSDNQRRRTIVLEKTKDASWGFTLESYAIGYKNASDVDMYSFVDYIELDGPAYRAGMRRGDVIIAVNGSATIEATHQELVEKIQKSRRTMRLIVLHEDICDKVEHQVKLIKLKHVLSEKEKELRRLVKVEEDFLRKIRLRSGEKMSLTTPCKLGITDWRAGSLLSDGDTISLSPLSTPNSSPVSPSGSYRSLASTAASEIALSPLTSPALRGETASLQSPSHISSLQSPSHISSLQSPSHISSLPVDHGHHRNRLPTSPLATSSPFEADHRLSPPRQRHPGVSLAVSHANTPQRTNSASVSRRRQAPHPPLSSVSSLSKLTSHQPSHALLSSSKSSSGVALPSSSAIHATNLEYQAHISKSPSHPSSHVSPHVLSRLLSESQRNGNVNVSVAASSTHRPEILSLGLSTGQCPAPHVRNGKCSGGRVGVTPVLDANENFSKNVQNSSPSIDSAHRHVTSVAHTLLNEDDAITML